MKKIYIILILAAMLFSCTAEDPIEQEANKNGVNLTMWLDCFDGSTKETLCISQTEYDAIIENIVFGAECHYIRVEANGQNYIGYFKAGGGSCEL